MNHFNLFPFVLSLSKDSEEVFQQPVFRDSRVKNYLGEISSLSGVRCSSKFVSDGFLRYK